MRSARLAVAALWTLFQLYTAWAGMFDLLVQLPVHVAFAVALGWLTPAAASEPRRARRALHGLAPLLALASAGYYNGHNERLPSRLALVDGPSRADVGVGRVFVA